MIDCVEAGFSRSKGFWARRIMSITDSWCCHCFIRFTMADGTRRIFESRIQTRGFQETDPAFYEKVLNPNLEAVAYVPVFTDQDRMARALELCEQWLGARPYPVWQLLGILAAKRYGIPVPQSDGKLICSEAVGVLLFEMGLDVRDAWHPTWDSVTPGSIWNNLMAIHAGYGSFNRIGIKKETACGAGYSKYWSLRPRRH